MIDWELVSIGLVYAALFAALITMLVMIIKGW